MTTTAHLPASLVVTLVLCAMIASPASARTLPAWVTAVDPARETHEFLPEVKIHAANRGLVRRTPQRIVSLAPVVTEVLFTVGAGARIVGVTKYCDRPAAALDIAKVGGFTSASLERIVSLRPDLVIAMPSLGQRQLLERLRERGVRVVVGFGDSIGEVRSLIFGIGLVAANEAAATKARDDFDASLLQVQRTRSKKLRAVVVVSAQPIVVAGGGTFANAGLRLIGVDSAVAPTAPPWPTWSLETLLSTAPDVVVAAGGPGDAKLLREQLARGGALKSGATRVISANRAILMRPGPSLAAELALLSTLFEQFAPSLTPDIGSTTTEAPQP